MMTGITVDALADDVNQSLTLSALVYGDVDGG